MFRHAVHLLRHTTWPYRFVLLACTWASIALPPAEGHAQPRRVLLVAQAPDGHPVGTHEFERGLNLLERALRASPSFTVRSVVADGIWEDGPDLLNGSDVAVLFLSEGAKWIDGDERRRQAFLRYAERGGGIVAIHWSLGCKDAAHVATAVQLFVLATAAPIANIASSTLRLPSRTTIPLPAGLATFECTTSSTIG